MKETICLVTDQRLKVEANGLGLQLLILLLGAKKTIASQSPVCLVATSSSKSKCEQLVCKKNNCLWVSSCRPAAVAQQQLPKVEANGVGMQSRHALLPRATTWTDDMMMMMMMIMSRHALVPRATTWTDDMMMILRRLPCYHFDRKYDDEDDLIGGDSRLRLQFKGSFTICKSANMTQTYPSQEWTLCFVC